LNGTEAFVDSTVVYFERPDDEQQIAHPSGGDSCTALYLSKAMLSAIWRGEPGLPTTRWQATRQRTSGNGCYSRPWYAGTRATWRRS
jgi:hypothetical protein